MLFEGFPFLHENAGHFAFRELTTYRICKVSIFYYLCSILDRNMKWMALYPDFIVHRVPYLLVPYDSVDHLYRTEICDAVRDPCNPR